MTTTISKAKRYVAFSLMLVFCFALVMPFFSFETSASTVDEKIAAAKQKAEEAAAKRAEVESEIASAKVSAKSIQSEVDAYQAEVDAYQDEIDVLQAEIDNIDAEIAEIEASIVTQKEQIASTQELLAERLRAMYMAGNVSTIEIIFEAESFEDLINRIELVSQITKHDNQIMNDLRDEITKLQSDEQKLEEDKTTIEATKTEIVSAQDQVKASKAVVDKKIAALNSYISKLTDESEELQQIEAQAEAEMNSYRISSNVSDYTGTVSGNYICPVPAKYSPYISSYYAARWGTFHYGIDITSSTASSFNNQVVAVANGVVLEVHTGCTHNYRKYSPCSCGSYGNYVVIDHGNNVYAWYAHLYSVNVTAGQVVAQGQQIGIVGCTGFSTGAHLHFEIRTSRTAARTSCAVNPLNYVHVP